LERVLRLCTHSAIFEDSASACQLADAQHLSTRARRFSAEAHFFWQATHARVSQFVRISSEDQPVDVVTEGLVRAAFEKLGKLPVGWQVVANPALACFCVHTLIERIFRTAHCI
jgi:hypothetical protein